MSVLRVVTEIEFDELFDQILIAVDNDEIVDLIISLDKRMAD